MTTSFILNGRAVALDDCDPRESLLRWLRRQHLPGTKEGCADGDCGACTVALVEAGVDGSTELRAVNSCLLPMGLMPGREVLTVEALADGDALHPVQQAMVDCAGSQCGYCTPGFVMSLFAGQRSGEMDDGCFEGNLCRCTGYLPIRAAATRLRDAPTGSDRLNAILATARKPLPAAELPGVHCPTTIEDALALKSRLPAARWIAGGTDLGVDLSHGRDVGPALIALDRIDALKKLDVHDDHVVIGAGVPLRHLEHVLHGVFPALDTMLHWFAARQVRNRATLGGNLGTASPIGDLLPWLLALDAIVHCIGPQGARALPIDTYFQGYRKTARRDDELITHVVVPRRADLRVASYKVAKRQSDDISIVAAVFALGVNAAREVTHARLAYGGVAAVPIRALDAEAMLLGRQLDAITVDAVGAVLRAAFTPLDDHRSSAAYRRALCDNLFAKFVEEHCGDLVPAAAA